jgi:hypothetical protein
MPEIALPYQPRVVICVPIYGWIPAETAASFSQLILNATKNGLLAGFKYTSNTYIHTARNILIQEAMTLNPTHLLFLDADMIVPQDTCQRLLRHQKNIVSGLYYSRKKPYTPIYRKEKEWVEGPGKQFLTPTPPDKFDEVGFVGFGCVMVSVSVIRKAAELNGGPRYFFSFANEEGEDVYFCRLMHSIGESIYLDPECECGHVTTSVVTKETYLKQNQPRDTVS